MELQIGRNIHSLRCRRRVSQEDLAQAMGVTVQAVSKWENGKANPDLMLLPGLVDHGFLIEKVVEESSYDEKEAKNLDKIHLLD